MAKITNVTTQAARPDRVSVYIDGQFCCGLRQRTFQAMNLHIGDEISCEELKDREQFFWKHAYGVPAWEKEKVRLDRVATLIAGINSDALVAVTGFGAGSTELIKLHPDEQGVPDISIVRKSHPETVLMRVEVTGTEQMRGVDYWVRPDKLRYAANHPGEEVWIVLHFAHPVETFIFIRPIAGKVYPEHIVNIRGAGEIFCFFRDSDEEVMSLEALAGRLNARMAEGGTPRD